MKDRDYASLALRKAPTFAIAEEVIRKDFRLKLPDRRSITMWNSPEISQFRGVQEDMDEFENRKHLVEQEKADIRETARRENISTPDMTYVHEAMNHQRQMASSFETHLADLTRAHAQQMAGMNTETRGRT